MPVIHPILPFVHWLYSFYSFIPFGSYFSLILYPRTDYTRASSSHHIIYWTHNFPVILIISLLNPPFLLFLSFPLLLNFSFSPLFLAPNHHRTWWWGISYFILFHFFLLLLLTFTSLTLTTDRRTPCFDVSEDVMMMSIFAEDASLCFSWNILVQNSRGKMWGKVWESEERWDRKMVKMRKKREKSVRMKIGGNTVVTRKNSNVRNIGFVLIVMRIGLKWSLTVELQEMEKELFNQIFFFSLFMSSFIFRLHHSLRRFISVPSLLSSCLVFWSSNPHQEVKKMISKNQH